jgi:hypothetical protein
MKGDFVKTQLLKYWLLWSDRGCYRDYADCSYPSNQQLVPGSTVEGPFWVGLKDIKDVIEWMSGESGNRIVDGSCDRDYWSAS